MDRWVLRGVSASHEAQRKKHQEEESAKSAASTKKERAEKAADAAKVLGLLWPWTEPK